MDAVFPIYEFWVPRWRFETISKQSAVRNYALEKNQCKNFAANLMRWKTRLEVEHAGMGSHGVAYVHPALSGRDVSRTLARCGIIRIRVHFSIPKVGHNFIFVAKTTCKGGHCYDLTTVNLPKVGCPIDPTCGGSYDVILGPKKLTVQSVSTDWVGEAEYAWRLEDDAVLQVGVHRFSCGTVTLLGLD
jgi:hypothetical protein